MGKIIKTLDALVLSATIFLGGCAASYISKKIPYNGKLYRCQYSLLKETSHGKKFYRRVCFEQGFRDGQEVYSSEPKLIQNVIEYQGNEYILKDRLQQARK